MIIIDLLLEMQLSVHLPSARNLGVTVNKSHDHTKSCNQYANQPIFISVIQIPSEVSDSSAAPLLHAMITSQLDYCNSLLSGILDCQVKRLDYIQNNAPCVVCKIKKYNHITTTLEKLLHLLPVKERIFFKLDCQHSKH